MFYLYKKGVIITNNYSNLIVEYDSYVRALANHFSFYKQKEDLYQAGVIGLIMAYKKYDSAFGTKFTTFAYNYIIGEMKKLVREDSSLKVSKDLLSLKLKIEKVSVLLTQKLMRIPKKDEVINFLGISEEEYDRVMMISDPVSLDLNVGEDLALYEVIGDKEQDYSTLIALREELSKLSLEEKKLLNNRYVYGQTQGEVASLLNTNQVSVSRQEKKILTKLRSRLNC